MNGQETRNGLTPRQTTIVRLLVAGWTVKEIAEELELSSSTVYEHLERIRARLGVRTLTEVGAHAVRHGLVETDGASPRSSSRPE